MICMWSKRNLSSIGRITVIKSFILPKLIHLFLSLPNPNKELIKEIDTLFFNYVWNSKIDRIARKHIVKQYHDGGLKMIHIENFIKSLKITWLRRLEQSNSAWATLLRTSLPNWFPAFHALGNNFLDEIMHSLNLFWRDVFTAVCDFRMLVQDNILLTPLWCNETFNINNRYMFIVSWFKKGLVYINDFRDENHGIMSLQDINDRFSLRIPFTTYFSIVRNI